MNIALAALAPNPAAPKLQPWDEMVDGRGGLRPRWGGLLATISGLGRGALVERAAQIDALLAEDGVTGLLPGAAPLALRCDPVPLILHASEFAQLEAGLAQRARLLEAVLRDVYGRQDLLASGAVPPELVYANPAFLRPCRDPEGAGQVQRMHVYAAELLRGPDGRWRVLADRTADAAGFAYALENRRVMSRVLPELFSAHSPRRLSPFFESWQDSLQRLAPAGVDQPGLVLLTPGPTDKLWFEHVVLARELSCTLAEGSDLTVREGALYLKTLRGLQQIHVLLRRQDGRTLDPLELDGWPRLGITGLLDAARSDAVRIVNDPGAGCLEAPAWAAVLPKLAQRLLGEDLALPEMPTLWLGDPEAYALVAADPLPWRLRPGLDGRAPSTTPALLSVEGQARFFAEVAATPSEFVAIAALPPSLAPCMAAEGLQPLPVVMRMFLVFDGQQWRALPGGLARVLSPQDLQTGRLPLHTLCKDVWVATEEDTDLVGPALARSAVLPIRRSPGDLPSRVADNFYWLGRNLERLEAAARLLRTVLDRLERPTLTPRESMQLQSLSACLVAAGLVEAEAARGLGSAALIERLLQIARPKGELPYLLAEVSHLTELLRDRLTSEVYATVTGGLRGLNEMLAQLPQTDNSGVARATRRILRQACASVLSFAASVAGLAAENMVRSGGRVFLDLGRRIERSWATSRAMAYLLDQEGAAEQPSRLEPGLRLTLELFDSAVTYRSRYLNTLQAAPVIDLVLADEGNPRALAFQLVAVRDTLAELAGNPGEPLAQDAAALLQEVREIARDVARVPEHEAAALLPVRLRAVERSVTQLSNRLTRHYFAILPAAHSVGMAETTADLRGMA